jgi:hypothetical protein
VAKTTYNIQEFRQRLAKHIEGMIDRVAGDFQDLAKREDFKKSLWATAHEEPGVHSPEAPGEQPHMEPGGDEQFALNPPATPEAATAVPIHGGNGVPPGQLENPGGTPPGQEQIHAMLMGDGPCPLCAQPEQNCKCLDAMILGKAMGKLPDGSGFATGLVKNASMGYSSNPGSLGGGSTAGGSAAPPAAAGSSLAMSEADGRNGDPTKKQPTKPIDGAKMPPEAPKKVKGPDDAKVKENPLGKTDVPQAKPPSGKVPGGTSNPPMASTTSKPGITKADNPMTAPIANHVAAPPDPIAAPITNHVSPPPDPIVAPITNHVSTPPAPIVAPIVNRVAPPTAPLVAPIVNHVSPPPDPIAAPIAKAIMNPQAQQHMNIDASRAAAPKPMAPPGGSAQLTHPTQMGRSNAHAAALAGEFQPKGPVTSGLELAPKGLTAPPPAARQGAVPAPKMATMPKPMGVQPTVPPKGVQAGNPGFGSIFGKAAKCVLCTKDEHVGECK